MARECAPATVLAVGWDGGGAVQPFLGLGRRLAERGHRVEVLGSPTLADRVRRRGLGFRAFERANSWLPRRERPIEQNLPAFTLHLLGPEMSYDTMAAIDEVRPDVVIVDHMAVGAFCGAERSGVPIAVMVHNLYRPWLDGDYAAKWARGRFIVNGGREKLGLDPLDGTGSYHAQLWERAALVLVNCVVELDEPPDPLPATTRYVGPIFADELPPPDLSGARDRDGTPLVLVSMSSTYMAQESVLRRVLDAFDGLEARAVVTLGDGLDPADFRAPAGVRLTRFVPHRELLPEVAAVVCHGGLLTVQEALAHGVPVLCMPGGRDNAHNSARTAECGAGKVLDASASPERIRRAVHELLNDQRYARAAARMGRRVAEYRDGAFAVEQIERLATTSSAARRT